jgi:hemolysin activation/secretion protein
MVSLLAWALLAGGAQAQEAVPRFGIARFQVDGNSLLTAELVDRIVAPFTGSKRDFGDIQRAMDALESAYRAAGYSTVAVMLPEQELDRGVVRLVVIEARVAKITLTGNAHFSNENVRASLPTLVEGKPPVTEDIGSSLRVANENAAKQTQVVLRAGEKEGELEALVTVKDEDPRKTFVMLDNTGTDETGLSRLSVGYQHNNVANRDQVVTLRATTSLERPERVAIVGAGYHVPFYGWGDSLDAFAGYSNVSSGTLRDLFSVTGSGNIFGLRYNSYLPRISLLQQKATLAFDYREFINRTVPVAGGASITPDYIIRPLSVGYEAGWSQPGVEAGLTLTYSQNAGGGQKSGDDLFDSIRKGAKPDYSVSRYSASLAWQFESDWQVRALASGQYTHQRLVPGEQFGIGGMNSVRGFAERALADDRGYQANLELYTPNLREELGLNEGVGLRLVLFHDFGHVWRIDPLPGELPQAGLSGTGLGVRWTIDKKFALRLDGVHSAYDFSTPIKGAPGAAPARLPEKLERSVHVGMGFMF